MLVFPNCKINIGLNIIRKRNDGFHDLETIFFPVKRLHDALEVIKVDSGKLTDDSNAMNSDSKSNANFHLSNEDLQTANRQSSAINFSSSGLAVAGETSSNLCVKAYHLLKNDFPELPQIKMHLHKAIPMGAGLGGGSADGAFTLKLLNDKFLLNLSQQQLIDYALQLGSDCPFFIFNQPCFATSRGEKMEPISLDLSGYFIVLINPNIHINTGWAFGQITPKQPVYLLKDLIQQPINTWKTSICNDFEAAVIKAHPLVGEIKQNLYANGAIYAAMSGSGSTLFGIFEKEKMPNEKMFAGLGVWHVEL